MRRNYPNTTINTSIRESFLQRDKKEQDCIRLDELEFDGIDMEVDLELDDGFKIFLPLSWCKTKH